jgi:hypothetical protein
MNILIKLTSIVALVIAPFIAVDASHADEHSAPAMEQAGHVCTPECMSSGTCPMHQEVPAEGAEATDLPAEGDAAAHSCTKECMAEGAECPHHA